MASAPKNEPGESEDKMTEEELRELMMEADKDAPPPQGITLGEHQFYAPNQNAPMSRMFAAKKQILGMPPPSFLKGIAREATKASPAARDLLTGEFCGHGEPTFNVYDIVIDGVDRVELACALDPDDDDEEQEPYLLAVRKPGGEWIVLYRAEWAENRATLEGVAKESLDKEEADAFNEIEDPWITPVSIGFEYPADATSADCVTWMTIECLPPGEKDPGCVMDAELA